MQSKEYKEGQAAFYDHKKLIDNPYPLYDSINLDQRYYDWHNGFSDAVDMEYDLVN